jgi:TolB-like protein/AraC-like DNA-binding protein/Tfp pilus assembly protein PilF
MSENTIAVLPFVNIGANAEHEYFSDGITEEIINALAGIGHLKVTSRTSSFYFKDKNLPLKEIAAQLGVKVILEGSIRLAGNEVRITAQLIQAEEDFHFWSQTWDRALSNIFRVQDEISLLIAEKLREQFGHFEIGEQLVQAQTDDLDAYRYSLKGKYYFNKWNPEDVKVAIEMYEKAIELDPRHIPSLTGLADAYGFLATTAFLPPVEAWEKAHNYTQRAHTLDPENAEVHYQLANLAFFTAFDFQQAAQHNFKAVALKPNYPEAQQFMAFLYTISGVMERAAQHLSLAYSINPLSAETKFFRAYFFYRKKDYEKALLLLNECLNDNPANIPAHTVRFYVLLKMGKYEQVLSKLLSMPEEEVVEGDMLGIRTLAHLLRGDEQKAGLYFQELLEMAKDPLAHQAHVYLFFVYANRNEIDAAFEWLSQSIHMKSPILLLGYTDPLAEKLTKDARYESYRMQLYGRPLDTPKAAPKAAPLLDDDSAEKYARKLMRYMEEERPFLDPGLSLKSLSERIELPTNQLSWLLNRNIGKNFNEFINHYRVGYFKELAVDPSNAHISIIGLAYESGFNSKTVFNTYFKKEEGMTPRQYLKQNL